ncbi:Uncharacterised protein [Chlamydia abortus]|nr:Uncharacterised protein [Chlamydia abortus]
MFRREADLYASLSLLLAFLVVSIRYFFFNLRIHEHYLVYRPIVRAELDRCEGLVNFSKEAGCFYKALLEGAIHWFVTIVNGITGELSI